MRKDKKKGTEKALPMTRMSEAKSYGDTELHTGVKIEKHEKKTNQGQVTLPMPLFENPGSFLLSMDDEFSPDESVMN